MDKVARSGLADFAHQTWSNHLPHRCLLHPTSCYKDLPNQKYARSILVPDLNLDPAYWITSPPLRHRRRSCLRFSRRRPGGRACSWPCMTTCRCAARPRARCGLRRRRRPVVLRVREPRVNRGKPMCHRGGAFGRVIGSSATRLTSKEGSHLMAPNFFPFENGLQDWYKFEAPKVKIDHETDQAAAF